MAAASRVNRILERFFVFIDNTPFVLKILKETVFFRGRGEMAEINFSTGKTPAAQRAVRLDSRKMFFRRTTCCSLEQLAVLYYTIIVFFCQLFSVGVCCYLFQNGGLFVKKRMSALDKKKDIQYNKVNHLSDCSDKVRRGVLP